MFAKIISFVNAKLIVNDAKRFMLKEINKEREPIVRDRLGFNIHEYMIATPDEIRNKQK